MLNARDIYQAFLDVTTQAVWDGEWDRLATRMMYPHRIATRDKVVIIPDVATLTLAARDFRENLTQLGATAYYRVCKEVEVIDEDTISGVHRAYALRGATPVIEPFDSHMTICRVGGRWLGAGIGSNARNADIRINIAVKGEVE